MVDTVQFQYSYEYIQYLVSCTLSHESPHILHVPVTRTTLWLRDLDPHQADWKRLDSFHVRCQPRILHISWHDFVSNDEVAPYRPVRRLIHRP